MIWLLAWLVIEGKMTPEEAQHVFSFLDSAPEPQNIWAAMASLSVACMSANVEFPG